MKPVIFTGAGVAIVTPFHQDGSVNFGKLEELIEFQIENHTDAIIICGTTGESSTLEHDEHAEAIRFTVKTVNGRVPVIAGTGSNDTAYCLKLSLEAQADGADALLLVTPYYNKTSQAGLVQHFTYIADRVDLPIIVYNVPSRTGVNILPETYVELAKHPRIVATKEANGDISALARTASLCGEDLTIYSGNDDQTTSFLSLGAKGVISVVSNICPQIMHDMAAAYLEGNVATSRQLQLDYLDLCTAMFCDVNPIPVKAAMNLMGMDAGPCRMPLAPLGEANEAKLRDVLAKHDLLQ